MKIVHALSAGIFALGSSAVWAQATGPTDPQIAAIVVSANQVDIDAGKLAKSKASSKAADDREIAAPAGEFRVASERAGAERPSQVGTRDDPLHERADTSASGPLGVAQAPVEQQHAPAADINCHLSESRPAASTSI